MYAGSLER